MPLSNLADMSKSLANRYFSNDKLIEASKYLLHVSEHLNTITC